MDKKIKADWVKALRSGEYKQGNGCLYRPDDSSFCCLGVLCTIIDPETITDAGKGDNVGVKGYLPEKIRLAISGSAEPLIWETRLADMNDNGRSFYYIANRIESEL